MTIRPLSPRRRARQIHYQMIRDQMAHLGYNALKPVLLSKWMMYRLIIVMANHLAWLLQVDAYRVYQAALCRAERSARAYPHIPYKQQRPEQGEQSIDEGWEGVTVVCPCCGNDLLIQPVAGRCKGRPTADRKPFPSKPAPWDRNTAKVTTNTDKRA